MPSLFRRLRTKAVFAPPLRNGVPLRAYALIVIFFMLLGIAVWWYFGVKLEEVESGIHH